METMTLSRGQQQQPSAPALSIIDKMLLLAANAATEEARVAATNAIPRIVAEQEKAQLEREKDLGRSVKERDERMEVRRKERQERWDRNMATVGPVIGVPLVAVGGVCGLLFLLWLVVNGLRFIFSDEWALYIV